MDSAPLRIATARRALASLKNLTLEPPVEDALRDAAIKRFEYTLEATWKAAMILLREQEGLELASPKGVVRASLQVGLLDDEAARLALLMVDDRNLATHTYNEALAMSLFGRLASHADTLERWVSAMENRIGS
jgi:nucleotidyltransferase substrate binding protein (TIGR01987 family)